MSIVMYKTASTPHYYWAVEIGGPSDQVRIGEGDSVVGAVSSMESTQYQSAYFGCRAPANSELHNYFELDQDDEIIDIDDEEEALAQTAYDPETAAREMAAAIDDDEEDQTIVISRRLAEVGVDAEIEVDDGEPQAYDESGKLWVVGERRLIVASETVAEWTRCVVSYYDDDGYWTTDEDTNGGDELPEIVANLLEVLGLEDELPEGADEPAAPDEDSTGEWGVGYTETDPLGAEPVAPEARYASREDAEAAIAAFDRSMSRQYPGGWLAPHPRLMALQEGDWLIVGDE